MDLSIILNDEKAKYSINGNLNLNTGENTITIIVTAEDESTKEYKFIITKEEDLKSNTNIKAYINEDTINFYNNKATYTVKTDQESVSIECIPDNDNAIINIDNPNPTLYTEVHHIDGDKLNNNADNLKWVTRQYNLGKPKTEYQILRTYLLNSIHNLFHEANEKGLDLTNVVNEILMFSKDVIVTNSVNSKIEVR